MSGKLTRWVICSFFIGKKNIQGYNPSKECKTKGKQVKLGIE